MCLSPAFSVQKIHPHSPNLSQIISLIRLSLMPFTCNDFYCVLKLSTEELMLLNCDVGEDSWESLGLQGDPTSPFWRSVLGVHWKDWCWSWNSNTLATSCEELTHWKRLWYWEGLGAGGEGDDGGWDGWMASLTQCTWVWVNSGSWWWTGRPGVLRFMGSQRVRHEWATDLNWTSVSCAHYLSSPWVFLVYEFLVPSMYSLYTDI